MGWEWDDVLPKKPEMKKKKEKYRNSILDFESFHRQPKTNVAKEMKDCVLNGIEKKSSVEKLPEKKLAKLRKVIFEWCELG